MDKAVPQYFPSRSNGGRGYRLTPLAVSTSTANQHQHQHQYQHQHNTAYKKNESIDEQINKFYFNHSDDDDDDDVKDDDNDENDIGGTITNGSNGGGVIQGGGDARDFMNIDFDQYGGGFHQSSDRYAYRQNNENKNTNTNANATTTNNNKNRPSFGNKVKKKSPFKSIQMAKTKKKSKSSSNNDNNNDVNNDHLGRGGIRNITNGGVRGDRNDRNDVGDGDGEIELFTSDFTNYNHDFATTTRDDRKNQAFYETSNSNSQSQQQHHQQQQQQQQHHQIRRQEQSTTTHQQQHQFANDFYTMTDVHPNRYSSSSNNNNNNKNNKKSSSSSSSDKNDQWGMRHKSDTRNSTITNSTNNIKTNTHTHTNAQNPPPTITTTISKNRWNRHHSTNTNANTNTNTNSNPNSKSNTTTTNNQNYPKTNNRNNNNNHNLLMFRDVVPEIEEEDIKSIGTNWSQRHLLRNQREHDASAALEATASKHTTTTNNYDYDGGGGGGHGNEHRQQTLKTKSPLYSPISILKIKNKSKGGNKKKSYPKPRTKSKLLKSSFSLSPNEKKKKEESDFGIGMGIGTTGVGIAGDTKTKTKTTGRALSKKRSDHYYQDLTKDNHDLPIRYVQTKSSSVRPPAQSKPQSQLQSSQSQLGSTDKSTKNLDSFRNSSSSNYQYNSHHHDKKKDREHFMNEGSRHSKNRHEEQHPQQITSSKHRNRQYKVWNEESIDNHTTTAPILTINKKNSTKKDNEKTDRKEPYNSRNIHDGRSSPPTQRQHSDERRGRQSSAPYIPARSKMTKVVHEKTLPKASEGSLAALVSPIHPYSQSQSHSHDEMSPKDTRLGIRPKDFNDTGTDVVEDIIAGGAWGRLHSARRNTRINGNGVIPLSLQNDELKLRDIEKTDFGEQSNNDNRPHDNANVKEASSVRNIGQGHRYIRDDDARNDVNMKRISSRQLTKGGQRVVERSNTYLRNSNLKHIDDQKLDRRSGNRGQTTSDNSLENGKREKISHSKPHQRSKSQKVESERDDYSQEKDSKNHHYHRNLKIITDSERIKELNAKEHLPTQNKAPAVASRNVELSNSFDLQSKIDQSWAPSPIKVEGSFALYNDQKKMRTEVVKANDLKAEKDFMHTVAAIVIQTFFRRHLAYRLTLERYSAVITIQRFFRSIIEERETRNETMDTSMSLFYDLAAIQIQTAWRGYWVRDCVNVDSYCATIIQRNIRMFLFRCRLQRKRNDAATSIQKTWRGYKAKIKALHHAKRRRKSLVKTKRGIISHSEKTLKTGTRRPPQVSQTISRSSKTSAKTTNPTRPHNVQRKTSKTSQVSSQNIVNVAALPTDDLLRRWNLMRDKNRKKQQLAEF